MAGHFAEIEFWCAPEEAGEMVDALRSVGEFVVMPMYFDKLPIRQYANPGDIPVDSTEQSRKYVIWNRSSVPPDVRAMRVASGGYYISEGDSDVIAVSQSYFPKTGHVQCHVYIDDYVKLPDGSYEARSERSIGWFRFLEQWIRARATLAPALGWAPGERVYVSERARELMLASSEAEMWREKLSSKTRRAKPRSDAHGTLGYAESFELLRRVVGLEGRPNPAPKRRPRSGDREIGPSFFRTSVADLELPRITLPGTYVGRSELRRVSLVGSDLHLSTFNWSDFIDCDFSASDLSQSDLRACTFERCRFVGANLSACDLRGSAFDDCDFTDAALNDAHALSGQRAGLPLSASQAAKVRWTEEYEEPEGG